MHLPCDLGQWLAWLAVRYVDLTALIGTDMCVHDMQCVFLHDSYFSMQLSVDGLASHEDVIIMCTCTKQMLCV